VSATKM